MRAVAFMVLLANSVNVTAGGITVENSAELAAAFEDLAGSMKLNLTAGRYQIDNPVRIVSDDISIVGTARDEVLLTPVSPGMPIFIIDADRVSIVGITLDGRQAASRDLAAFGIVIADGVSGCRLADNAFRYLQGTAIIGYGVEGCTITDNIISGAGGDGIRLKGNGSILSGNLIRYVFDEPLDLQGANVDVTDNWIRSGRIGIALESFGGSSVSGNVVREQYEEGIVLSMAGSEQVVGNFVDDAGIRAYALYVADDAKKVIIRDNVACQDGSSNDGKIAPEGIAGVSVFSREDCPPSRKIRVSDEVGETGGELSLLDYFLPEQDTVIMDTMNDSHLASHLRHLNPGILSVSVSGSKMSSDITSSLARTLTNWPDLASGPVRWLFLRSNGVEQWFLLDQGDPAILVTRRHGGSRIRITALEDGEPSLLDKAVLVIDRLRLRWEAFELF